MDRLKKAAVQHRRIAAVQRDRGRDAEADRHEARADALESGRVTDRTDDVIGIFRAVFRR
ncbi:hypothetical protein [Streptomyces sp. NBC_00328]|uniref:hypothetical protein n=1 Tax=Streptomyces sp. NBC_00328 TaxID=2903646 RepID=UPI002E2E1123|nr:hypothetical protein [Streptomyces sp. NBC_00328]